MAELKFRFYPTGIIKSIRLVYTVKKQDDVMLSNNFPGVSMHRSRTSHRHLAI